MSFFKSIEILVDFEEKNYKRKSIFLKIYHLFNAHQKEIYEAKIDAARIFARKWIKRFDEYIQSDDYSRLADDLVLITGELEDEFYKIIPKLSWVMEDFQAIAGENIYPDQDPNRAFSFSRYQILNFQQHYFPIGIEGGFCNGITLAMVVPHLSPYFAEGKKQFRLSKEIYDFQNGQLNRKKDQESIKQKRLTRRHYCPQKRKQANEIFNKALAFKGKDLHLSLRFEHAAHACYLKVLAEDEIYYMDPNFGAYIFDSKAAFTQFYVQHTLKTNYKLYELSEMIYDPNHELKEDLSISGMWRTFLTGPKYLPSLNFYEEPPLVLFAYLLYFVAQFLIASLPLMCIITANLFVMPLVSWILAPIIIALVVSLVALNIAAMFNQYSGFLGMVQFLKDSWNTWILTPSDDPQFPDEDNMDEENADAPDFYEAALKSKKTGYGMSSFKSEKEEQTGFQQSFFKKQAISREDQINASAPSPF